jgi:TIR domain
LIDGQSDDLCAYPHLDTKGRRAVKVFISWSGEPSRSIARALTEWLRPVVQHIDPWMSDERIRSGTRWREVIGKVLDATDFGIICLTRANQHEPWLVFEAGALAKRLDVARVVPLCIDMAPSDITGPLEGWQGNRLEKEGMRRLVYDLNDATGQPVPQVGLGNVFDAMWPQLESATEKARDVTPGSDESDRTEKDMLAELVERTRRIEDSLPPPVVFGNTAFTSVPTGYVTTTAKYSTGEPEQLRTIRIAGRDWSFPAGAEEPQIRPQRP